MSESRGVSPTRGLPALAAGLEGHHDACDKAQADENDADDRRPVRPQAVRWEPGRNENGAREHHPHSYECFGEVR